MNPGTAASWPVSLRSRRRQPVGCDSSKYGPMRVVWIFNRMRGRMLTAGIARSTKGDIRGCSHTPHLSVVSAPRARSALRCARDCRIQRVDPGSQAIGPRAGHDRATGLRKWDMYRWSNRPHWRCSRPSERRTDFRVRRPAIATRASATRHSFSSHACRSPLRRSPRPPTAACASARARRPMRARPTKADP